MKKNRDIIELWKLYGGWVAFIIMLIVITIIWISTSLGNSYWDTTWHWQIAWVVVFLNFFLMFPRYFLKDILKSNFGHHWNGDRLTEDNLETDVLVEDSNGNQYTTGNRRNITVELYQDGVFKRTAEMDAIRLIKLL